MRPNRNGTLIAAEWCELFKSSIFKGRGVSLIVPMDQRCASALGRDKGTSALRCGASTQLRAAERRFSGVGRADARKPSPPRRRVLISSRLRESTTYASISKRSRGHQNGHLDRRMILLNFNSLPQFLPRGNSADTPCGLSPFVRYP